MAAVFAAFDVLPSRRRVFKERKDQLEILEENEILERYRLSSDGIRFLEGLISHDCGPRSNRSRALSTRTKLLITLRYLAKGDFFSEVADLHGVSKSSVCRSIKQVVSSIDKNLDNINFPTTVQDVAQTKLGFYQLSRVPNVIGAVDGTQIPILAPSKHENIYVCRKGFHSINVQAIVDSELRFTNINARWPGSTHDSAVFDSCNVKQWLEDVKPGWLLGDSGYPLCPYLITPILNPQNDKETRFNVLHSRARVCVERAFGILKERFRDDEDVKVDVESTSSVASSPASSKAASDSEEQKEKEEEEQEEEKEEKEEKDDGEKSKEEGEIDDSEMETDKEERSETLKVEDFRYFQSGFSKTQSKHTSSGQDCPVDVETTESSEEKMEVDVTETCKSGSESPAKSPIKKSRQKGHGRKSQVDLKDSDRSADDKPSNGNVLERLTSQNDSMSGLSLLSEAASLTLKELKGKDESHQDKSELDEQRPSFLSNQHFLLFLQSFLSYQRKIVSFGPL